MIKLGILGGGQLAMLSCLAAQKLNIEVIVFSDSDDSPAFSVCKKYFYKEYTDKEALAKFAEQVDFVTYEFENIPVETLEFLAKDKILNPSPEILNIAKNRLREKRFINSIGIKTAEFAQVSSLDELKIYAKKFAYSAILKTTELGYDGKGQYSINENSDFAEIWQQAGAGVCELVLEKKVAFKKEVSAIVVRNKKGEVKVFPVAENLHEDGILRTSTVPAAISGSAEVGAKEIAVKIAEELGLVGILAVEMFLLENGDLLVNEMAPRPHNSGHYTIDACNYSQFSQFVLAATESDLKDVVLEKSAVMHNLLGDEILREGELKKLQDVHFYNYGKKSIKSGRKMGHYTVASAF